MEQKGGEFSVKTDAILLQFHVKTSENRRSLSKKNIYIVELQKKLLTVCVSSESKSWRDISFAEIMLCSNWEIILCFKQSNLPNSQFILNKYMVSGFALPRHLTHLFQPQTSLSILGKITD